MTMKCEICGTSENIVGVASSRIAAFSFAWCSMCIRTNVEPWGVLVGTLMGLERGNTAEWLQPVIDATCEFYGKTEDDLWAEVKSALDSFDEYNTEKG